jgi:hypothetical protein
MKSFSKVKNYILHHDICYTISNYALKKEIESKKKIAKRDFDFIYRYNCCDDKKKLLLIVIGFQPDYWKVLLKRIYVIAKENRVPVCLCIPGVLKYKRELYSFCEEFNFSSLFINDDRLGRAQNIAIKLFPEAELIYKIDEDIVIGRGFFKNMNAILEKAEKNERYKIGFVCPLINDNTFSYIYYLNSINKISEYETVFGKALFGMGQIHSNPSAAVFIWETLETQTFDQMEHNLYVLNQGKYVVCPQRFSIGAILFRREIWEKMGMFTVGRDKETGLEERDFCAFCMDSGYRIVCDLDAFVGHLGYFTQKEACKKYFLDHIKQIEI